VAPALRDGKLLSVRNPSTVAVSSQPTIELTPDAQTPIFSARDPASIASVSARSSHDRDNRLKLAPRVLIVDESADSREVLRTLLARRGALTIEARQPDQALQLTQLHQPDLIVFDADSDHTAGGIGAANLKAAASRNGTPIVILGTVRDARKPPSSGQFVPKPYHYGPLINKIENLLAAA
jgi:PleD family two-component response regulator